MTEVVPTRFAKRVFFVEALQVTSENMEKAAEWCGGEALHTRANPDKGFTASPYVKVKVKNPRNARQTRAFANDWIVKAENGAWRVYPQSAFNLAFESVQEDNNTYVTK